MLSSISVSKWIVKFTISQAVGLLKPYSYWVCAMRLNLVESLMSNKRKSHLSFSLKENLKGSLVFPQMPFNSNVLCPSNCYSLGKLSVSLCRPAEQRVSSLCFSPCLPGEMPQGDAHRCVPPAQACHMRPKLSALCS